MQTSQIKFELSLLKLQNEISAKSLRKCSHMNCPSSRVADELSILTQLILQKKNCWGDCAQTCKSLHQPWKDKSERNEETGNVHVTSNM